MNTSYFPFTDITEYHARAFFRRFGRFAVYEPISGQTPQSLRTLSEEGVIELRHPVTGDEKYLVGLCRSFQSWGVLHQGEAMRLKRLAESGFYNEAFAAEIRSEVLKSEADLDRQKPDPVINARMFLQLAHEFDARQSEIEQTLESTDKAARSMFEALRGEVPAAGAEGGVSTHSDAGAFMTAARITAWTLLFLKDVERPASFFLTDSAAVMDRIADLFPELAFIANLSSIPDQRDNSLCDRVERAATSPWEGEETVKKIFTSPGGNGRDDFDLHLYIIPGHGPENMMARFIAGSESQSPAKTGKLNTVIGLLVPGA